MSKELLALQTILESVDTIFLYSKESSTADDFYHDRKSFDACMIHFINIGEMIDRISMDFRDSHSKVPWQEIKNFRNIVAHNYFGIDAEEIWDIIEHHLPELKTNIKSLIHTL